MTWKTVLYNVFLYGAAFVACVFALFPIYRIIAMSFMPPLETFALPPKWLFSPTIESYRRLFEGLLGLDIRLYLWNSIAVAVGSTILALVAGLLGAYATARFSFRFRNFAVGLILVTRMLPPIAMIVPMFLYMYQLDLLDTRVGLALVYTGLNIPFAFWMLYGFIKTVPSELIDAALVDGCSEISALVRIVLPVIGPGIVAASAFCFIFAWNDFALAAVITTSNAKTMPMMIFSFRGPEGVVWGPMAAGATMAIAPPVILLLFLQKWMVRGLTMGATKG